ncbi:MAG: peptidyl-prolyl cis-trans isomerase, partial [Betaproteobacteria bacterium]|nr:peptidyl-prolyl cis-trans isomerase [Betaproteobacteria bacterium]
ATSQFYINLVDNRFLDYASDTSPGYAVFGSVSAGMDVIDLIAQRPTQTVAGVFQNVPVNDVLMLGAARIR